MVQVLGKIRKLVRFSQMINFTGFTSAFPKKKVTTCKALFVFENMVKYNY